ncbi:hypothetical protein SGRIM119S_04166 [Streptomyces griseorubiginosus]
MPRSSGGSHVESSTPGVRPQLRRRPRSRPRSCGFPHRDARTAVHEDGSRPRRAAPLDVRASGLASRHVPGEPVPAHRSSGSQSPCWERWLRPRAVLPGDAGSQARPGTPGWGLRAHGRVTVVRHLGRPRDGERRCAGSSGRASAAGPALPHGKRPTRPRDTGTTPHGPIHLRPAAVPAVAGEEPGQAGNWPDSAVTCLRCSCLLRPWCRSPWCRCGRSCGCRGSCRRRACWSGRRST